MAVYQGLTVLNIFTNFYLMAVYRVSDVTEGLTFDTFISSCVMTRRFVSLSDHLCVLVALDTHLHDDLLIILPYPTIQLYIIPEIADYQKGECTIYPLIS